MRLRIATCLAAVLVLTPAFSATTKTARPAKGPARGKAKTGSSGAAKKGTAVNTRGSRKGRRAVAAAPPRRYFQQTPTPERYREIQKALADKGYFKGESNGEWGPESVDALRKFQLDQNLQSDGKIGSRSLIALGLGPHRQPSSSTQPMPDHPQ
jgi:peptidoglycan hydrolase-like protein with peptidoglycan-binding domain